jgi:primosomal protein N'
VPFGWGNIHWQNYLAELFPQATIRADNAAGTKSVDIEIATPVWSLLPQERFDLVLAIEPERLLFGTDFRATERWLQFLLRLREHARTRLLIETNIPDEQIFTELAAAFPKQALTNELRARKQFGYPPYGHILQITLESSQPKTTKLKEQISTAIGTSTPNLPLLGPIEIHSSSLPSVWQWLIKLPRDIPYSTLTNLRTHLPTRTRYELDPL